MTGIIRGHDHRLLGAMMIKHILTCTNKEAMTAKIHRQHVVDANGCWIWTGYKDAKGYGRTEINTPDGTRKTGAHRAAWLAIVGDIPEGLQIDHLCRTRACVNIAHFELVTGKVNCQRADNTNKGKNLLRPGEIEGCSKHGLAEGRVRVGKDGYDRWDCQACARAAYKRWYDRQKAVKAAS